MRKIEILQITPNAEKLIEQIGRVCYASEHLTTEFSHKKFIKNLIEKGHESVLEHAIATFHITGISRACAQQLTRHRIASMTMRSQRYCKENEFEFYIPQSIKEKNDATRGVYRHSMEVVRRVYDILIESGIKPEDARMVLPNACHTQITTTMNFRELRHFFNMRCDKHAQEEIRMMAKEMLKIVYEKAPACFEDLYLKFINVENKNEDIEQR